MWLQKGITCHYVKRAEFFDGQTHIQVLDTFVYCCIEVLALGANIATTAKQLYQCIV